MERATDVDWVSRLADEVVERAQLAAGAGAEAGDSGTRTKIVCASGISPSGPVHLGNLREVLIPHLVADELRRRGIDCEHLISFDDYDRFRRVPAGVDPSWEQHIGKPLSSVPAPPGSRYQSWAAHFLAPLRMSLERLGIGYRGISQTQMYTSGAYQDQVLTAMAKRHEIDRVLGEYRTRPAPPARPSGSRSQEEQDAAAAAREGSGAAAEDDGVSGSLGTQYFPYRPYCTACGTDATAISSYDDQTTRLSYECRCGHTETVLLREFTHGKLLWKVDWPMRWAYEGVDFEPSGVDHSDPGSSFTVGARLVGPIFGGRAPLGPMYAFVGIKGMAKMSSSRGSVPTPGEALEIMEAPVLRWMFARRRMNQSFTIALDQDLQRLYDEWDALGRKVSDGSAQPADRAAYSRATRTAEQELPRTPRPLPYRTLVSVADITTGDQAQTLRILGDLDPANPLTDLDQARPRLDCAQTWALTYLPAEQRTSVRGASDTELLRSLDPGLREQVRMLCHGLAEHWSLDALTSLVYAVPKLAAGLPADAKPTAELKLAQRELFAVVYRLLVGRDTGPRLPTLLLAVGLDRARELLGG